MSLTQVLGDAPQVRVISALMEAPEEELTKVQIANRAKIGRTTLYRVWDGLENNGVLVKTRDVGPFSLYRLNRAAPLVRHLLGVKRMLANLAKVQELYEEFKGKFGEDFVEQAPLFEKFLGATDMALDKAVLGGVERKGLDEMARVGLAEREGGKYRLTERGRGAAEVARLILRARQQAESAEEVLKEINAYIDRTRSWRALP